MKPSEAAAVLARAALYDRRTVGEIEARAWAHALGDHNLADALTAVDEHYGESDRWIMPVHVNERAARIAGRHVGKAKREQIAAQIAAENAGDADPAPVTTGGPGTPLALTAGPLRQRLPDVQAGRRAARDRYRAIREGQAGRDAVRKLDAEKRAEVEAELDALRRRDEPRETADV